MTDYTQLFTLTILLWSAQCLHKSAQWSFIDPSLFPWCPIVVLWFNGTSPGKIKQLIPLFLLLSLFFRRKSLQKPIQSDWSPRSFCRRHVLQPAAWGTRCGSPSAVRLGCCWRLGGTAKKWVTLRWPKSWPWKNTITLWVIFHLSKLNKKLWFIGI